MVNVIYRVIINGRRFTINEHAFIKRMLQPGVEHIEVLDIGNMNSASGLA